MKGPGLVTLAAPICCLDGKAGTVLFAQRWAIMPAEALGIERFVTRGGAVAGSEYLVATNESGDVLVCVHRDLVLAWMHSETAPPGCYDVDRGTTCNPDTSTRAAVG